ncbi:hypothetical protein A9Z40_01860 [Microbacterium arborescens]|uniref:Uncharacterized protein n=1 Tax=Microbacterium arborescens TaxID=33883 RepID=A0ABX2WJ17_9MICO|nr:hypothetical protein [Microbacterium arborescens]OAZ41447.1 hypothetical protein A9Z40_01860 [Microbacterium arborescens]
MGNQALITTPGASVGIDLHWNGGRDSVTAFLRYAELAGLPPLTADGRGYAQLVAVLVNFFGNNGLTVSLTGVNPRRPEEHSMGGNGVYLVSGHEIVGRINPPRLEQNTHDLDEMLQAIDQAQPERDRLGGYLDATERPTDTLAVGDRVWMRDHFSDTARYTLRTVVGHGTAAYVNGACRLGVPYVDLFENQDNSKNPNSYITSSTARVAPPTP